MKIIRAKDYNDMSRKAANIISAQVILKPDSVLGLATGSSPIGIYEQLIKWYNKGDVDFGGCTTFNLDEYRGLTPDHEQSYHYFMHKNFFDAVNVPAERINLPDGAQLDAERECKRYDAAIKAAGGIDLQLLGIGLDGHIGFNEPGDCFVTATHVADLHESTIKANSRFFANENEVPRQAISMGMVSIMQAKKILLIANGPAKKDVLLRAFEGPITPELPASILQLHPDLTVIFSEE